MVLFKREASPCGSACCGLVCRSPCGSPMWGANFAMAYTPSTAGTFRKNSGKNPETLSERFLEFSSRVRLGSPNPYNSRHLRRPEHFQNSLPPVRLGAPLFQKWFRTGPLRACHGIPSSTGAFLRKVTDSSLSQCLSQIGALFSLP